jgi:hypothetical protein
MKFLLKINYKKGSKKDQSQLKLIFQTHDPRLSHKRQILKNYEVKFSINQILRDKIEKNNN